MQPNLYYIVTKPSNDGTFELGDQFFIHEDGLIENKTARGFMDLKEFPEVIEGMEYKVDEERLKEQIELAKKKLDNLNKLLGKI